MAECADASHQKSILYDDSLEIPHTINVEEHFIPKNNRQRSKDDPNQRTPSDNPFVEETDIPMMQSSSRSSLKFTGQQYISNGTVRIPDNLVKDTLKIDEIPLPTIPLSENSEHISGNMTCMKMNPMPKTPQRTGCFQNLIQIAKRLSTEDIEQFAVAYIKPNATFLNSDEEGEREIAIDVLGAVATEITQGILTDMILLSERPNGSLIMQTLIHFVELDNPPAEVAVEAITRLAFGEVSAVEGLQQWEIIHNRAVLVLGSVAKTLRLSERNDVREKGDEIVKRMEDTLGIHDKGHHRQIRSALSDEDYNSYIEEKATLIYSLGNAISPTSYEHLLSYVNNSDSHPMLRRSGVHAISKYSHQQAARRLLDSAIHDDDETVRYLAATEYLRHSHAEDFGHLVDEQGNINTTYYSEQRPQSRKRRGLFEEIQIKLQTPSFEWINEIGTSDIGGSMGLVLKNAFNLDIKPLEGSVKVDVYNHAFIKGKIGYFNFEFSMLDAKVCFMGESQYSLNILQEFNFEKIEKLATQFDSVVNNIVTSIQDTMSEFNELLSPDSVQFSEIFDNFMNAIGDMPSNVRSLTMIAQDILKRIGKYNGLPEFFYDLQNVIFRVTGLFNAVRKDVMELYNSVNDAITVTLPWAVEQVNKAMSSAESALEKLYESPISAIKDISRFIFQIKGAVSAVLHAKTRIEGACYFGEGKPPYWFDMKGELIDIWEELLDLKHSIQNAGNWSLSDDNIKEFTGISGSTVRVYIVADILGVFDMMSGPFEKMHQLAEPFVQTYEAVSQAIENMKAGFEKVKTGYEQAKTFVNKIFGSRGAKMFPRKIAESSCGEGFYPCRTGNTLPGIDLEIRVGAVLVSPFTGNVTRSGPTQITIDVEDELKNTQVIIDHVNLDAENDDRMVFKGMRLGTVTSSGCRPNTIHLAMRQVGTRLSVDPTRYIEPRKMLSPPWIQHCDEYVLIFKGAAVAGPKAITGGPKTEDESPKRAEKPNTHSFSTPGRSKRAIHSATRNESLVAKGKALLSKLGLPLLDDRGPLFDLNVKDTTVRQVFEFLDAAEQDYTAMELNSTIEELEELLASRNFRRPETLTDDELRMTSSARGKESHSESRPALIKQFREPEERCHQELWSYMPNDTFCNFDIDCKGIYCDIELGFFYFPVHVPVIVRLDSCQLLLWIVIGDFQTSVDLIDLTFGEPVEDYDVVQDGIGADIAGIELFQSVQIVYKMSARSVEGEDPSSELTVKFDLQLGICSSKVDRCMAYVTVFKDLILETELCDSVEDEEEEEAEEKEIEDMTLSEFEEQLSVVNIDQSQITALLNDILLVVRVKTIEEITTKLLDDFENEFSNFDMKLSGGVAIGPINVNFFERKYPFMIGPVPMSFGCGASGSYGLDISVSAAVLSMKLDIKLRPEAGAAVYGVLGVGIPFFTAELHLTGHIMSTAFPSQATVQFNKFPLVLQSRMDLVMIPLKLELKGMCIFEMWLPFGIHIREVVFDVMIWSFTTQQIEQNIFSKGDMEPDNSPPAFTEIAVPEAAVTSKRATSASTECSVKQLVGRDHTDPAFELAVAAGDDRSEVNLTYCLGTYKTGCDILDDQTMGGQSVIVTQLLPDDIPLHFTVKATNSAEQSSMVTCLLPTYDVTLPEGRIVSEFYSTSRPDVIRFSAVAFDDSPIVNQKIGIGFGYGLFGDQIVPWSPVTSKGTHSESENSKTSPLDNFTKQRQGRLQLTPYLESTYSMSTKCAEECVQSIKCAAFNYDFGDSGHCELLDEIEGNGLDLHEGAARKYSCNTIACLDSFYYFEKLGAGRTTQFNFDNLQLRHGDVHYINMHITNSLGYENVVTSLPIHADFQPPSPGPIHNALRHEFFHDDCVRYVLDDWEYKCVDETQLLNHRLIIDGPGSATVFNGHDVMIDLLYTRANTYVSANWDGFHDDETGIFGYTWAVGTSPCQEDIVAHKDPHSHVFEESEWTHRGSTSNFHVPILPDGRYYITVRAINKVDFGGPMATTVCHSTPYTIDTTEPFVNEVLFLGYDEDTCMIAAYYNVSDDLSNIREIDMGLGKSKRDVYIMGWQQDSNITLAVKEHCIPDGLPAWIKIRAINNVNLRTIGHAESPIIIDTSPPTAGEVFDGRVHDHDIDYQNKADELCVSWHNFFDVQSGVEKYTWHVGTSPGNNDTIANIELDSSEYRACNYEVNLVHNNIYFSTITSYNAGHKKLSTSVHTNGVLYDETAPVEGWIKDGLDTERDMAFSPKAATVSANWDGYYDPESQIKEFMVTVWRRPNLQGNPSPQMQVIHEAESVSSSKNFINWHHFHLHHKDYIHVELETINKALTGLTSESDGYLVDLTEPIFHFVGDGPTVDTDLQYTASATELSVNWNFEDPESEVKLYKISIYETYGGTTTKVHPKDRASEEVHTASRVWTSSVPLSLVNGAHYSIRVAAVNGAGLSNVQDTDGVFVDFTPPIMRGLSIGVLTEHQEEEIIDGFVLQTDIEGIKAFWEATDFQSGVVDYQISVGTSPGGNDVLNSISHGPSNGGYIGGLTLQRCDPVTGSPVYYLSVKATNGAGLQSEPMISSAIRVVANDKTGFVFDGPEDHVPGESMDGYVDIDYQRETGTVTAQFNGFESEQHGIVHYEWAVGSQPGLDDIQPYISAGIITDQDQSGLGGGMAHSGKAQSLLPLEAPLTYYTTVRAITGAGNVLDSVSDGFTVDTTPPIITVDNFDSGRMYQKFSDSIVDSWHVTEDESEVYFTEFCYGSYPGASDVYSCTDSEGRESIPIALVQPNTDNLPNVITVSSVNKVGLWSKESSKGITIDTTPPTKGTVNCPSYISTSDELKCTWSDFYDKESGIAYYLIAIGLAEEDDSVHPYTVVNSSHHEHTTSGPFRNLTHYVTVSAVNDAGDKTNAFSQPIYVDETPPIPGRVVELSGVDEVNFEDGNINMDATMNCMTLEDCASRAAVCQKSLDRILVTWEPFQDPESPVVRYQIAVGSSPGGAQLKLFYDVDLNQGMMATITGVDLYDVRQAFVSVRGFNAAGLHTTAVSDGIYISRISAGLPPLEGSYVWDGNSLEDLDYQNNNDVLNGQWRFDGDPCPKMMYEWSINKIDGTLVQRMTKTTDDFGMNDDLSMKNGDMYYLTVRATNLLGYSHSLRSDGITIELDPLEPRDVRDGAVYGFDLNFQSAITSLSANWDVFGIHPDHQDENAEGQQVIDHYEVSAGTDQRYPNTRDDIHRFVNVGLNTTYTFTNLQLIPKTQTYYVTVRAYAASTAMVEVTSNGIKVGFGGEVLSQGHVSVPRHISSTASITVSWENFQFSTPVLFYTWGIGRNQTVLHNLPCKNLQTLDFNQGSFENPGFEHLFEESKWTNVGEDTLIEKTGLSLQDGQLCTVVVMATDESGQCSLASADFTVDLSPPSTGNLKIGSFQDQEVTYTDREDILQLSWSGFYDMESGLQSYSIALYDGISCETVINQDHAILQNSSFGVSQSDDGLDFDRYVVIQDFVDVLPNDTDYSFIDLRLQKERPYFVHLRATNNAGLSSAILSPPVLLDLFQPIEGTVKDGLDYRTNVEYQSSTSTMEGVFLHLPNREGDSCPSRHFAMQTSDVDDWNIVKSRGIWGVDIVDTVSFRPEQLTFSDQDQGLAITLVRDVKKARMYSGAFYHPKPDIRGGTYDIEIMAADGNHGAVTSVVFWDGPSGVVGDFNIPVDDPGRGNDIVEFDACAVCCFANITADGQESNCPCNCTEYLEGQTTRFTTSSSTTIKTTTISSTSEAMATPPPWQIIKDVDKDDTYRGDSRLKSIPHQSFGFQLHPGVRVGDETKHFIALWFRHQNISEPVQYDFEELNFDPSKAWHSYRLDVINEMGTISIELYADWKSVMFMTGIPVLSPDAKFILSAWNRHAFVPQLDDIFNPPTVTARFRNVRFPLLADALCKYGQPFRNGDNAIVAFFAGIGSEKLEDDIMPFREVLRPCIPCTNPCDSLNCDPDCSIDDVSDFKVVLDGLTLNTSRTVIEEGTVQIVPAVYHLTIKAVTGSGRYAIASSNGVYIDDTPPVFDYLYHVDVLWSVYEPIEYQGSNTTIAVRWNAYDIGSQILEYKWAIGHQPNTSDIQDFVSVGLATFAANDSLYGVLEDRGTYYVTVHAINRAGLITTKFTNGVTLMVTPPDVTASNATSECDDNDINTDLPDASLCGSQSSTGMKWTSVEDESVDSYHFSIGSSPDNEDIFPDLQVGYNTSGDVEIKDGSVFVGDKRIANVSGVREADANDETTESVKNRFHMEPGRTMCSKIKVCNKGHQCGEMATAKTTVARKDDTLSTPVNGSGIDVSLTDDVSSINIQTDTQRHRKTRKRSINPTTEDNPEEEVTLMAGFLSNDDLHDEYASDASRDFKPFIVNPDVTKDQTDRDLRNRIQYIIGPSFYATTIGRKRMKEPFNATLGFNTSGLMPVDVADESAPRIIFWHTEMEQWRDAGKTCEESFDEYQYNWQQGRLSAQVCSTDSEQTEEPKRRRSIGTDVYFRGPTFFTVASVGPFVNTPPVMTSSSDIWMSEDEGTIRYIVTASDTDGDDVIYTLDESSNLANLGEVSLSKEGELSYKPCLDCFGVKSLHISAKEDRTDNHKALSTSVILRIDVRGINDNPDIFLVTDPLDVTDGMVPSQIVTTEERKEDNDDRIFKAVVGAFDPDTFDTLTLLFDLPQHGTLHTGVQHTAVEFINDDCLPLSNITDDYLGHNNSDVDTVLFPCKLPIPHTADRLAWVFSTLTYIPEKDFHGEDSFKLNAVDQSGAHSDVITVKVHVLANPCFNGGVCNDTHSSLDCSNTDRSKGFDGYFCSCQPGYTGQFCTTDFNECQSNPCQKNFTCIDQVGSFACYCENINWPCGSNSSPLTLIASVCSGVVLAAMVIVLWRWLHWKKKRKTEVAPTLDDLATAFAFESPADDFELTETEKNSCSSKSSGSIEDTVKETETDINDDNNPHGVEEGDGDKDNSDVKDNDHGDDVEEVVHLDKDAKCSSNDDAKLDTGDEDAKVVFSVQQRFGFVDAPKRSRQAWGRNKSDVEDVKVHDPAK
ncbi:uncharacterized protein [Ptychodera flava]|uniref:uncharacterized protein n=1 Tax=Ptychodera flava TaxID=63121 RepID=UPI00396AA0E5